MAVWYLQYRSFGFVQLGALEVINKQYEKTNSINILYRLYENSDVLYQPLSPMKCCVLADCKNVKKIGGEIAPIRSVFGRKTRQGSANLQDMFVTLKRKSAAIVACALIGFFAVSLVPQNGFAQDDERFNKLPGISKTAKPSRRFGPSGSLKMPPGATPKSVKTDSKRARNKKTPPPPPKLPGSSNKTNKSSSKFGSKNEGKSGAPNIAGSEDGGPWDLVKEADELPVGIEYKKPRKGERFSFNLVDADLIELIKIIGNITGKSFILGGKVPNIKATIYAPTKINSEEAYRAFLSVLQVNNLTVVPSGRYLKILSVGGATSYTTPIYAGKNVPPRDQIVTRLHQLSHVSGDELSGLLDRFKSSDGDITVYSPTNTLIITDYGTSIKRLMKLIGLLDVPGTGEKIWVEPINFASADELANRITEIFDISASATSSKKKSKPKSKSKKRSSKSSTSASFGSSDQGSKISKILADERTNSLIIVASEDSYLRILELVKVLDVPIAGEGTLHVHKLQHADSEELSKTLSALSKGSKRSSSKKGKGAKSDTSLFEGEMQISADKATNSLVIVSSLRDYLSLKTVIETLDSMQRQVFVEAVIMEVSLDKNRDIGLGFHGGKMLDMGGGEDSLLYGSSQPNSKLNSLMMGPGTLSGLAAGLRGPELDGTEDMLGAGISIPAFGIALQAMQTNSDVNVLSTPHILATDNVEASITVGENVPVQQGYGGGSQMLNQLMRGSGNSGASSAMGMMGMMGGMGGMGMGSIGRQNVGLTLKITPYINDDNQVRLEMDLEISEVKSVGDMGPNISQQQAKTTSVVADQQTIVIGGLITDNQVETTSKVPVLGDIPLLGMLFRHKTSLTKKRNLLIFLTPYIIRTPDDFKEIFNRKMAERREFIERFTAFEYHKYDPHLDWSRTSGAVSVVNQVIGQAKHDEELRQMTKVVEEDNHDPKEAIQFPHGARFDASGGSSSSRSSTSLPAPLKAPAMKNKFINPAGGLR